MKTSRTSIGALVLSAATLVGLAVHEGYRDTAYIPVPGDRPTLGFGDAQGVKLGDRTNPVRALIRLNAQAEVFQREMRACLGDVPLHQHEWDSYVSLTFNIGIGKAGVVDGFCWSKRGGHSTLVDHLKAGNYTAACDQILRWNRFQGKPLAGLTKRRAAENKQCLVGN